MTPKKILFTQDIVHNIRELCALVFNIATDEQLCKIFCISHEQMEMVMKQLVNPIPDWIFDHRSLAEEIKNIIAREFIFFQLQEKWDDPHYQDDLENFINIFSRDIQHKIEAYKNHQLREVR
ncbi:MAG: hypothetical protein A3F11_07805 [Gammaproteobacteria bacterium RIFCSPHIGHO2_12_FULL_37_14]|nr:MAG: hypothetical protein A3F11_07805 [Gammaproteobacteria bacterium RIFCSPHIGHO2_12_FULL_37_14]